MEGGVNPRRRPAARPKAYDGPSWEPSVHMTPGTSAPERPTTPAHDAAGPADGPGPDDVQPTKNEALDRFLTGTVTVLPFLALFLVGWQVWGSWLHWSDIAVFFITYIPLGLGIAPGLLTTGFGGFRGFGGDGGAGGTGGGSPPSTSSAYLSTERAVWAPSTTR